RGDREDEVGDAVDVDRYRLLAGGSPLLHALATDGGVGEVGRTLVILHRRGELGEQPAVVHALDAEASPRRAVGGGVHGERERHRHVVRLRPDAVQEVDELLVVRPGREQLTALHRRLDGLLAADLVRQQRLELRVSVREVERWERRGRLGRRRAGDLALRGGAGGGGG